MSETLCLIQRQSPHPDTGNVQSIIEQDYIGVSARAQHTLLEFDPQ